jgi:pentatricopeptide repeat protein
MHYTGDEMKTRIVIATVMLGLAFGAVTAYYFGTNRTPMDIPNLSPRSQGGNATAEFLNAQKAIEYYRQEIRKKPDVVKNYVELAQVYIQEARVTALHHEYFPKAERLLDKALGLDPNDVTALSTKASMYATLHRFEEAKSLAHKALNLNPHHAATYSVLIDALVELGEYDEAVKYCDSLLAFRPDLRSYARASYLREIHGDNIGARRAMLMACEAGVTGQENRAWSLYILGRMFLEEGKLDTAEFIFKGILEERPGYAFATSGIAQVRTAQQRYDEAIRLLEAAWATTPEHAFLEQLVAVYRAAGRDAEAHRTIDLVLKEFADHTAEGWNVDREFAAFCAEHDTRLAEALERAQNEYRRRPRNIDVLDTYAYALFKNGRGADALPIMQEALRLGTEKASLKFHAAQIYAANGDIAGARTMLQQSLKINPSMEVLHRTEVHRLRESLNLLAANDEKP